MKIGEVIERLDEIRRDYPGGINFQTKSRFLGFSCKGVGGQPDAILSVEMLESDEWAFTMQPMDKEFVAAIKELFAALTPSVKQVKEHGFKHPCRTSCEGWMHGYDRGQYEAREEIERLQMICRQLAKASQNKQTKVLRDFFGKHFEQKAET